MVTICSGFLLQRSKVVQVTEECSRRPCPVDSPVLAPCAFSSGLFRDGRRFTPGARNLRNGLFPIQGHTNHTDIVRSPGTCGIGIGQSCEMDGRYFPVVFAQPVMVCHCPVDARSLIHCPICGASLSSCGIPPSCPQASGRGSMRCSFSSARPTSSTLPRPSARNSPKRAALNTRPCPSGKK